MYNPWQHPSRNYVAYQEYVNRYSGMRRDGKIGAILVWGISRFGRITRRVGSWLMEWGQRLERVSRREERQLA